MCTIYFYNQRNGRVKSDVVFILFLLRVTREIVLTEKSLKKTTPAMPPSPRKPRDDPIASVTVFILL